MAVAHLQPKDYVSNPHLDTSAYSLPDALAYTRWLATSHYENFHVVSVLLPKKLHQDFYNIYSFCRWADDLGDEIDDPGESLRLLAWWREELQAMYGGETVHPVFVALRDTVNRHGIPQEPFERLICAFEQDQTVNRYANLDELKAYCVNSANPVGHLVLYLCGYRDAGRQRLSDFTCTALQLANFWQDVSVDLQKGRVYIPLDLVAKHGYTVDQVFRGESNAAFRSVMADAVSIADDLFQKGLPLIDQVDRRLACDLQLFSQGGMKILEKIKLLDYDVLAQRPHISKAERVGILLQCLPRLIPF